MVCVICPAKNGGKAYSDSPHTPRTIHNPLDFSASCFRPVVRSSNAEYDIPSARRKYAADPRKVMIEIVTMDASSAQWMPLLNP